MIKRFRFRKSYLKGSSKHLQKKSIKFKDVDKLLARSANASQVGVLLLAIFGYFYTVLPVYQKALLDEEIAKKTIELQAMKEKVLKAESVLASREADLIDMNRRIEIAQNEASKTKKELNNEKFKVIKLKDEVNNKYNDLLPRLLNDFVSIAIEKCNGKINDVVNYSSCVSDKAIDVLPFSEIDKKRLKSLFEKSKANLFISVNDFEKENNNKKRELNDRINDLKIRCEENKKSSDYLNEFKKINIDSDCSLSLMKPQNEIFRLDIDYIFKKKDLFYKYYSNLIKDFWSGYRF